VSAFGQTIKWVLEDPPPEELLRLEPEYDFARYAEGVKPRGAERVEVLLYTDGRVTSVKLFPPGWEELEPESVSGALEKLARDHLPPPPPWPAKPPGTTTPDPPPDLADPRGI